ncbi:hypothetical protein [Aliamphritea hakodatensis]|nr:hypothetical protein [Aliamphritea hakodatensis]
MTKNQPKKKLRVIKLKRLILSKALRAETNRIASFANPSLKLALPCL